MIRGIGPRDQNDVERSLAVGAVRWGAAIFLALHGWLHWGMASAAQRPGAFRIPSLWGPDYASPVLDGIGLGALSQLLGGGLWLVAAIGFVLAALGVVRIGVPAAWSRVLALVAAAASLLLLWLFWTDPVWIGAIISAGIALVALAGPAVVRLARPRLRRTEHPRVA